MKYLLFCSVILLCLGCSSNASKIEGKWKLEEIDYSDYFKDAPIQFRELLEDRMEEEFQRLKDKTFFTFSSNQVLKLEVPNYEGKQNITEGKWRMNSTEDSVFFELSETENFKIITLDDESMELSTDDLPKRKVRMSRIN
jgi:hypothetical protein